LHAKTLPEKNQSFDQPLDLCVNQITLGGSKMVQALKWLEIESKPQFVSFSKKIGNEVGGP